MYMYTHIVCPIYCHYKRKSTYNNNIMNTTNAIKKSTVKNPDYTINTIAYTHLYIYKYIYIPYLKLTVRLLFIKEYV